MCGVAAAQTGRVGGTVKDESGQPVKGATVTAQNPNASPSSFTATTDDKGRFSVIGLRGGMWTFSAQAPGFAPESGKLNVQHDRHAESAAHLHIEEGLRSGRWPRRRSCR